MVPPFVALSLHSNEPVLRMGLDEDEADAALGPSYNKTLKVGFCGVAGKLLKECEYVEPLVYFTETDFLGNSDTLTVHLDRNRRVKSWETEHHARTRPPWLDKALKWIGW
jgi:hypothetical protein